MAETPNAQISPADLLLNAITELNDLCGELKDKWSAVLNEKEEQVSSTDLKLLAEYRQLLKLQFEVLRKARSLVDEACFQRAVLIALRGASEDLYNTAISLLWELERVWNGDDEGDSQLDDGVDDEDQPD